MNFSIDKDNIGGFIVGCIISSGAILGIVGFLYHEANNNHNGKLEIMQTKIADKDKTINELQEKVLSNNLSLEVLKEENEKLKLNNDSLKEKIKTYTSFRPIKRILHIGESWVDEEVGIDIKLMGEFTIKNEHEILLEIKLPDSKRSSVYLSEKDYKNYIRIFQMKSESYKLTIEKFYPMVLVVTENK